MDIDFSFSFGWIFFSLVVVAVFLVLLWLGWWWWWRQASTAAVGGGRGKQKHLVVHKEDVDFLFSGAADLTEGEPYLPDSRNEIAEIFELDGITPSSSIVNKQIESNVAENLQRLRRNLETKWNLMLSSL